MKFLKMLLGAMISAFGLLAMPVQADVLEGYSQLSGTVTGSEPGVLPVVYAYNNDKDVGYTVYVIDGKYRAVNLIPGSYDVTIRPAVDQLEGFTAETVKMDVGADVHVKADFALKNVGPVPNYVNGLSYEPCTANRPAPEDAAKLAYAVKHGGVERGKAIGDCEPYIIQPYDEIFPPGALV